VTTLESRSPQNPTDLVTELPVATVDDVAKAAGVAREAQRSWWAGGAAARSAALRAAADRLRSRADEATALVVREVGKPAIEARGEVARSVSILDYYAQAALDPVGESYPPSVPGLLYTERRPHGLAGLVTPWNFPLAIPLWKAAPALTVGNAVLLKPSPDAIACAAWLGELLAASLPDGLVQVLPGGAETGSAVVAEADVVSFTGSEAVGSQVAVAATRRGVAVQAEMGGQNAAIVLPDADAAATAAMVASAAMGFAGQKCTATRRVVVVGDEARQREVTDALVAATERLTPGDPASEGVLVGPVITATAQRAVVTAVAEVTSAGGQLLTGGDVPTGDGYFVAPAIATGVPADHRLAQEETFGPLCLVLPARDGAEAVRLANDVRYGLVTSVHGRDLGAVLGTVNALESGLVKVNAPTTGVDFYAPFGGEKASSIGPREQGKAALAFYSSTRTVTITAHP
jgi:aldehyde dehydrogenase (NAD+)